MAEPTNFLPATFVPEHNGPWARLCASPTSPERGPSRRSPHNAQDALLFPRASLHALRKGKHFRTGPAAPADRPAIPWVLPRPRTRGVSVRVPEDGGATHPRPGPRSGGKRKRGDSEHCSPIPSKAQLGTGSANSAPRETRGLALDPEFQTETAHLCRERRRVPLARPLRVSPNALARLWEREAQEDRAWGARDARSAGTPPPHPGSS